MTNKKLFMVLVAFLLAGCGGGGGGASSSGATSTPLTCPAGESLNATGTACVATVAPAVQQNFQAAVSPTYAANSEELGFFNAVAAFRAAQGLGPLNQNPQYDLAARAHANYLFVNQVLTHTEIQGASGFTGITPLDRVQYQGAAATYVGEEAGLPDFSGPGVTNTGASFATVLINTVFHRNGLLFQGPTDIGVSIGDVSNSSALHTSVSDLGYNNFQQVNAGTYFSAYPVDGQTGVSLQMHSESPSPLPAGVDQSTYASPINVASQASTTLTVQTFTITQQGATTALPSTILTVANDPTQQYMTPNLAYLLVSQPFLPNTTYNVNFVGTITGTATGVAGGLPVSKKWSFTTGATSD